MARKNDAAGDQEFVEESPEEYVEETPDTEARIASLEFKVAHLESIYGFTFDDGSEVSPTDSEDSPAQP